jgi:hypothetical protein
MRLLQLGKQVRIFTALGDKALWKSDSRVALSKYLARHGLEAVLDEITSGERSISNTFKDYVAEHKVDLLIMG